MALHAVKSLARLGKHQFVDPIPTTSASEARRMVRVVAGHNGLVEDGEVAYFAVVAIRAHWRSVG